MNYIQIHHLLLCHILSTHFIVQMWYSFTRYFQCFSSPFPAFIIISICTHSHGSANIGNIVHNLSMGICLHLQRYHIWEVFVVLMKLMWVWYHKQHDVHIDYISIWKSWVWYVMLFHVTCFYVYNIYWTHNVEFWENTICVCCVEA